MANTEHVGDALPDEPSMTAITTAIPSVVTASATPSLLLSDGGGGGDDSGGEAETGAVTLALDNKSFNIVLGCLHVAERAAFAQSNVASTVVVKKLYETLRDHHPDDPLPLFMQFGITNPVDLSELHTPLTEQSVELLVAGGLCCCVPTGISFAGFAQRVRTDRELPGFLEHALSRLVVLRAGGRIQGPLPALIERLPFHHTRVLDLQGCCVTGDLSVFSGMNINVLSLAGCSSVTGDIGVLKDMPITHLNLGWCKKLTGDVSVFKDMPIKELNLWNCQKLTGNIDQLPKSITDLNLASTNLEGDISTLAGAPIKNLDLSYCKNLTGNIDQLPKSITNLNLSETNLEGTDKAKAMFPNAQVYV